MSTFKDIAKAKFREKLSSIGEFYVEEWETTVYFKPMTMKEMGALEEVKNVSNSPEAVIGNIISRARDADMALLFKKVDRLELLNEYNPDTLADISLAMTKGDVELKDSTGN